MAIDPANPSEPSQIIRHGIELSLFNPIWWLVAALAITLFRISLFGYPEGTKDNVPEVRVIHRNSQPVECHCAEHKRQDCP